MNREKTDAARQAELQAAILATAERRKSKGFARGTLIHTAGGLVPIEVLRPGYMVLSRTLDPGKQADPPVVKPIAAVQAYERTPVVRVEYERPGEKGSFSQVTVAPGQPLWTLDKGWVWAGEISGGWIGPSKGVTVSGAAVDCDGKTYLRDTERMKSRHIWFNDLDVECALLDRHLNKLVDSGLLYDGEAWDGERRHKYGLHHSSRTTTYSIEVEGLHTFFVGPHGLLVGDRARAGEIAEEQERRTDHP